MNRMIAAALAACALCQPAGAQMRVQGTRPVDPRLRNQPTIPAAPQAVPAPQARPVQPTVQVPAQRAAPAGGPLRRPSYLGGGEGAPSGGPSSLDLMKQCFDGSISGTVANPACVGYLAGYVGAIRMSAGVQGFPICLPESGVSNESLVSDVSSYLEENPDSLQKSARSVFFVVMSDRYPCPQG